jgi:hypothetical protein
VSDGNGKRWRVVRVSGQKKEKKNGGVYERIFILCAEEKK